MRIEIQKWIFDVDVDKTQQYTKMNLREHCECGYCRNYYMALGGVYPLLKPFLVQFGAHPDAPVDFLPIEPTLCIVSYAVSGVVVQRGPQPISLDGLLLDVEDQSVLDYELRCPKPYFVFTTDYIELPWLLSEDKNEVISPANEPEALKRMWRKVLERVKSSEISS